MTCSQTEKVSLLIDGELPQAEALQVKRHLLECSECHEAHESFLLLRGELTSYQSTVDAKAVNAALAEILSRESRETPHAFVPATTWRERFTTAFGFGGAFTPQFAAAAALILLAVGIGIIALLLRREPANVAINSGNIGNTGNLNTASSGAVSPGEDPQKSQTQKAGGGSRPTTDKEEARPKPAQTPGRNTPRPPRRRTEPRRTTQKLKLTSLSMRNHFAAWKLN